MSYGAASQIYNNHNHNHNHMKCDRNSPRGTTTTLTKDQEDELADWILLHQQYGNPRTKQDINIAALVRMCSIIRVHNGF